MPAGGVGVTAPAMVLATPIVCAPIGAAGCALAGAAATAGGELRIGAAVAPAAACKRWPQCWQKAKPTGVPLPHAGQIAFGSDADAGPAGAAAAGAGALTSAATVAAEPAGAALVISEVPHILQKFMPGGLTVPQELQVVDPATAGADGLGAGAGEGSRRWPQSWQNSDPSRLTFPQWLQRGIALGTSRVKGKLAFAATPSPGLNNGAASSQIMKLSRPTFQIKPTALLLILAAGGCAPLVAQAPFSARADTVVPGDLLGPFDGRVVDAQSGKPLPGALVQALWTFEVGRGLVAPAGGAVRTVATDSDGRFLIDRLAELPSAPARVARVTVIVYQRGYVGWRSDRVFDATAAGGRARTDFCQHNSVAKLERWSPVMSHVKHVRFVGGAGPLKRALGNEVLEASLELSAGPSRRVPDVAVEPEGAPLDAGGLLSVDELRAVTGYGGPLNVEKLGDLPSGPSYDSRHFKAVGKAETYDAALRLWRLAPAAAEARYAKLLAEVPHAESKDEIADRSLRGFDGRIVAVAALDRARGVVIELTCGLDQCRDADQAAALLRRVMARLDRLGAPPPKPTEAAPPTEEPPAPPPPATTAPPEDSGFKLRPPELKR